MRTFKLIAGLFFLLLVVACQDKKRSSQIKVAENESKYVVLAYVTSWGESTPDPACLTHINYAFGHVTDNFKGIRIDNEPRLQMVVGLREKKTSLKVLLSVGGWGSSRFSEMAQTDSTRIAFAADCKRVIDQFDLDGIDIDWEYPGIGTAGVSFSPEDTDNFSLLMKDVRHAIGKDKLLTIATQAGAKYYNLRAVEPYVDYVNIMTYDMGRNLLITIRPCTVRKWLRNGLARMRLPPMLPQVFLSDAWYWVFRSMGMGLMKLQNYWIIVILSLWILYRVVGIVRHKFLIW